MALAPDHRAPPDLTDRFAGLAPAAALALAAALAVLILLGLMPVRTVAGEARKGSSDLALYARVIDDVRAGQPYYAAATREQRAQDYPLRPFLAVRPPTLTLGLAALPGPAARAAALSALALAVLAAWGWRLRASFASPLRLAVALAALATGVVPALTPGAYLMHECWAGLLIALSLALRRPGRWAAALAIGLAAAAVRELAAPYLLVMAVLAWRDGERREAGAWAGAIAVFAAGLALHAAAVAPFLRPTDPVSPGWLAFGGWPYLLTLLQWNGLLSLCPLWAAGLAAPLAAAGLAGRGGVLGERLALTVLGYGAAFLVVGRPDNSYWGLMIAPLWPLGLALAAEPLASLARQAFRLGGCPVYASSR